MSGPAFDEEAYKCDEPISSESTGRVLRRIRAKKVVTDILSGISDQELMRKYNLTPDGLGKLLIQHAYLYKKSSTYRSIVNWIRSRRSPRLDIPTAIRCYNYRTSQKGFVRDISENGIRVAGIEAEIGETMTLFLPLQELQNAEPVDFETLCRWSKIKGKSVTYSVSGFEITNISPESRTQLGKLMELARGGSMEHVRIQDRGLDTWELMEKPHVIESAPKPRQFSGELAGVDILDVVQFALLSGKKTVLVIKSSACSESRLYLDSGKVVHAFQGDKEGEDAFFACTEFDSGRFFFEPWKEPEKHSVRRHADWLLF